jgi:hypothetical protein
MQALCLLPLIENVAAGIAKILMIVHSGPNRLGCRALLSFLLRAQASASREPAGVLRLPQRCAFFLLFLHRFPLFDLSGRLFN